MKYQKICHPFHQRLHDYCRKIVIEHSTFSLVCHGFRYFFTLFAEFFSHFNQFTCALSVLHFNFNYFQRSLPCIIHVAILSNHTPRYKRQQFELFLANLIHHFENRIFSTYQIFKSFISTFSIFRLTFPFILRHAFMCKYVSLTMRKITKAKIVREIWNNNIIASISSKSYIIPKS